MGGVFKDGAGLRHRGAVAAMFMKAPSPAANARDAIAAGVHLVSIDGAPVNTLRNEYPFFRLARIPAGTYANQPESVYTLGTDANWWPWQGSSCLKVGPTQPGGSSGTPPTT